MRAASAATRRLEGSKRIERLDFALFTEISRSAVAKALSRLKTNPLRWLRPFLLDPRAETF